MTMIDYKSKIDKIYIKYDSAHTSLWRARIYIMELRTHNIISKSDADELHKYSVERFNDYSKGLS